MKIKLLKVGYFSLIFVVSIIFSWLYYFAIVCFLNRFKVISNYTGFFVVGIASVITSLLILIYEIILFNSSKTTKFSNWISMNRHKLILYYIFKQNAIFFIQNAIFFIIIFFNLFGKIK